MEDDLNFHDIHQNDTMALKKTTKRKAYIILN